MTVDAPSNKHRLYVYDRKRRLAGFDRRYQTYLTTLTGFSALVFRAFEGNTDQLCDHLQSAQFLIAEDREELAWLIRRKLHRNPVGHPPGRNLGPITKAEDYAALLVIENRKKFCAEHGRKRLPKGLREDMIEHAIQASENKFPEAKGKIDRHNIEMSLKSIARKFQK